MRVAAKKLLAAITGGDYLTSPRGEFNENFTD